VSYDTIEPLDLTQYMREFDEQNQVVPAFMYAGQVKDYFHGNQHAQGSQMPWSKTHGKIRFREGEVSIWAGYNGSGKSMLLGQVMLGVMQQGETACIASMEMRPHLTVARMCRQSSGSNIPSEVFIDEFHEWLSGKLWMYVQQGTVKSPRMLALARYCGAGILSSGKKVKIRHLVIDSLMKCGIKTDDYNTQKDFVDGLTSIAKDTGVHIHLVCHMRKGDSEFREGDKMDIKGASELSDQVDNVFLLSRNKTKEDELVKPNPNEKIIKVADAFLSCRKQRHGEWEGKIALWFDKKSMQYVSFEGARPIDFLRSYTEAA
jgi:twinkle protein